MSNRGRHRWIKSIGLFVATLGMLAAAPAGAQTKFPGARPRPVGLSPDPARFRVAGVDAEPMTGRTVGLLTGDSDWLAPDEDVAEGFDPGFWDGADSPDDDAAEPDDLADEDATLAQQRDHAKQAVRHRLEVALLGRPTSASWRRMMAVLETDLHDWTSLAILELYDAQLHVTRVVMLAQTPRGCFSVNDIGPWHGGANTDLWDRSWRAQPVLTQADAAAAERFFTEVRQADEPDVALAGEAGGVQLPRLRAVLHVLWAQPGGYREGSWRLALMDPEALFQTWARDIAPPQLDAEAVKAMVHPKYDPDKQYSPRWDHVLVPQDQRDEYERIRDHFAARARQFWMAALPPQRPTDRDLQRIFTVIGHRNTDVAGAVFGFNAVESDFWLLSRGMLRVLSREDFRAMIGHRNPKVRAMGMLCLARIAGPECVDDLAGRLTSRASFVCFPFGCVGSSVPESRYAMWFLHNPRYLDGYGPYAPLISRPEQLALDLDVLARDATASAHFYAANALSWALHEEELELTLPALGELAPELSDTQLVRAVGRIRPQPPVRAFLLAILADQSLAAEVRLAAGSALTRDADAAVAEALAAAEDELNQLADGAGTQFLWIVRSRAALAAIAAERKATNPSDKSDRAKWPALAERLLGAMADCPMAWLDTFEFDRGSGWALSHAPPESAALARWRQALVNLAESLDDFAQPWNTYGRTPYRLDYLIGSRWDPADDGFFIDDEPPDDPDRTGWAQLKHAQWLPLRRAVDAYLAQHEGEHR